MAKTKNTPAAKSNRGQASPRKAAPPARGKPAPAAAAPAKPSAPMEKSAKPSKKSALRESILARKSASKPIAFSLDEVKAIAKTNIARIVEPVAKR